MRPVRFASRTTRRLTRRLGRRGAALGWFATLDLVFGLSMLDPAQRAVLEAAPTYRAIALVDLRLWAAIWLTVGLLCLVQAWMTDDRWAFSAQVILLWIWAALTLAAAFAHAPRAVIGAVVWSTFGGFVLVISGWPEAPRSEA